MPLVFGYGFTIIPLKIAPLREEYLPLIRGGEKWLNTVMPEKY